MHNNRADPVPATLSQYLHLCFYITSQAMRWDSSTLHHTYRRKGHYRPVAVISTTPNNNMSTFPLAGRTEIPPRIPTGRVQGTARNDPVAGVMNI
jgi:hypothetical protein